MGKVLTARVAQRAHDMDSAFRFQVRVFFVRSQHNFLNVRGKALKHLEKKISLSSH